VIFIMLSLAISCQRHTVWKLPLWSYTNSLWTQCSCAERRSD